MSAENNGERVNRRGHIEVICGSMFCGKTEELIRRARRALIAKQQVQVFKPVIDTRYGTDTINSHSGIDFKATPINEAMDIIRNLQKGTSVVALDEGQFVKGIAEVAQDLAEGNFRVIVAGLDTDFRGVPFGEMPVLLTVAEEVTKLHAICTVCGQDASRTQRIINGVPAHIDDPIIMVEAQEAYEARCRKHHEVRVDGLSGDIYKKAV